MWPTEFGGVKLSSNHKWYEKVHDGQMIRRKQINYNPRIMFDKKMSKLVLNSNLQSISCRPCLCHIYCAFTNNVPAEAHGPFTYKHYSCLQTQRALGHLLIICLESLPAKNAGAVLNGISNDKEFSRGKSVLRTQPKKMLA